MSKKAKAIKPTTITAKVVVTRGKKSETHRAAKSNKLIRLATRASVMTHGIEKTIARLEAELSILRMQVVRVDDIKPTNVPTDTKHVTIKEGGVEVITNGQVAVAAPNADLERVEGDAGSDKPGNPTGVASR